MDSDFATYLRVKAMMEAAAAVAAAPARVPTHSTQSFPNHKAIKIMMKCGYAPTELFVEYQLLMSLIEHELYTFEPLHHTGKDDNWAITLRVKSSRPVAYHIILSHDDWVYSGRISLLKLTRFDKSSNTHIVVASFKKTDSA
jgi:hypothetical protein